jgi:hypothetical protein
MSRTLVAVANPTGAPAKPKRAAAGNIGNLRAGIGQARGGLQQ